MTPEELAIREKLLRGMYTSYNMLIDRAKQRNGVLYFSRNGKVEAIKATDLNTIEPNIPDIR